MKGFRGKSGSRRAGAHSRDLRPARQAADRVGQRPTDDRSHGAAVEVVSRRAGPRHVAGAVARRLARVCSAPQCRTAMIARASANRPHPDRACTSRRHSRPCSSTATSRPRSSSRPLHATHSQSIQEMGTGAHSHAQSNKSHTRSSLGRRTAACLGELPGMGEKLHDGVRRGRSCKHTNNSRSRSTAADGRRQWHAAAGLPRRDHAALGRGSGCARVLRVHP
jgi:hypothetical protein